MESNNRPTSGATLGQYLEKGRQDAGLSLRQLAAASGVNIMTIRRLLGDEVESPSAEQLQRLAQVLELDEAEVFAFIGITPPKGLSSIAPNLRAKFKLRGDALSEAAEEILKIINKYDGTPPDK
jgi:transcriptional regulator with XRE-family HTH domain